MSQCKIAGCKNPIHARNWCQKHYARWFRTKDPLKHGTIPGSARALAQQILSKSLKSFPKTKCVTEWPFAKSTRGYPSFWDGKSTRQLPRTVCERHYGPPANKRIECAHSCNNPSCYNPHHLRWATRRENQSDRQDAGTWGHVLNAIQVAGIYADPRRTKEIQETYKVSHATVNRIKNRQIWKHVSDWLESH